MDPLTLVALWLLAMLAMPLMAHGARLLEIDAHPGHIDFGVATAGSSDAFKTQQVTDAIISPDITINANLFHKEGSVVIEDILVWDIHQWRAHQTANIKVAGAQSALQASAGGITHDNTILADQAPTSDAYAQHTRPGGSATVQTTGSENSRYVERFDFFNFSNEENATGEINSGIFDKTINRDIAPYQVGDGVDFHLLLTAAHYHMWQKTNNLGVSNDFDLGALARRVDVGFSEVLFDRKTFLGILDAVTAVV